MTIVQLTTDGREPLREYDKQEPWFGAAPEALLQGFAYFPEVAVHVVSCTQQKMRASPEKLAPNIWFHSLHVPKLGWMFTGYQGCVRAVQRRIREINPDLVHGQGTERDCALSAVFSGFPNVLTIHGNMSAIISHQQSFVGLLHARCAAFLEGIALRRTSGVFCNSAYTQRTVRPHALRTWLVPNALRRAFVEMPVEAPRSPIPVLLNIGGVLPWKGQVGLLELAREMHAKGSRFILKFVGGLDANSRYGRVFLEKMKAAEAAGYAEYVGTRDVPALIEMLDSASALLHAPSEEAFGLVVAEALARNLKLFTTRVGGIVDIVEGVDGAEVFEPGAWSAMAAAIQKWLSAGAPQPTIAADQIRARYHPETIARRHLEIYREVLAPLSE